MEMEQNEPAPAPETRPAVSPNSKFASRGFKSASEIESEGLAAGETPPSDPVAAAGAAEGGEGGLETGLPEEIVFADPNETVDPVAAESSVEAEAKGPTAEKRKIKIGERYFANQDEAWAYAEELERKQLVADATLQGIEMARQAVQSNQPAAQKKAPENEVLPDEYYTNPAAYQAKLKADILAQATTEALRQSELRATHERTMTKFWSDNPDLSRNDATKELTIQVIAANFNALKDVDAAKAMKIIAEKARSRLKDLGVTTLPTKPLNSNTKPAASVGSGAPAARPKQDDKTLNFVQQSKNLKAQRRAARARK